MLLLINLQTSIMQAPKISTTKNPIRKLQISIPNFTRSQEKEWKRTSRPIKSKSNIAATHNPYTHRSRQPISNNKTLAITNVRLTAYKQKSPKQNIRANPTKIMGLRLSSKSPRSKLESPRQKMNKDRYYTQAVQSNINTSRNIDEVKKKLSALSSKNPSKIVGKYFKRETEISTKLEDMNRTLKKMSEIKNNKKPKYQLKMLRHLGKSQTGDIILAVSNINGILVAVKSFKKDKIKLDYLIDQFKIHLYCCHPNILPAYGYHIGKDEAYLVMEFGFCNLYQEILRKGPFSEEKTAKYIAQILSGLDYLHRNGIIHRDLKPQNVICFDDHLKITDFGWSIKTDCQRRTLCGTLDYISPEVAQRNYYDNKIDCWSVGVLMYEMLTVQPPFPQTNQEYEFAPLSLPQHLSKECSDFLEGLLKINPQQRLSAKQALDHAWIKKYQKNLLLFQRRQVRNVGFQMEQLLSDG